jgi:hypothetical protein
MEAVIQLSLPEEAKALPILLRHSPGVVLPNRTYILGKEAVVALRHAGIHFTELSRQWNTPSVPGKTKLSGRQ